jgi:hypothetical protein
MKFNKWTMGLAAVGVVSLASAARADDTPKMSVVNTALSATTLSGYVDFAASWRPGTDQGGNYYYYYNNYNIPSYSFAKNDGFSLNAIDIALDKPQDDSPWAAGYHIELMSGADAVGVGGSGFAVRQAYLALRTPVGNSGIDWKFGVFDTIIGYESSSDPSNPNYTRSYGYTIEPTTHTGVLATYKVNDIITVAAGVANSSYVNSFTPSTVYESQKAYLASISLTAPDSAGFLKGATLSFGVVDATDSQWLGGGSQTSWYAGATVPTPWSALKVGASFDYYDQRDYKGYYGIGDAGDAYAWVAGLYANVQINDKASLNLRGEYIAGDTSTAYANYYNTMDQWVTRNSGAELTATFQYNIWANVISRAEVRWDHAEHGNAFGSNHNYYYEDYYGSGDKENDFLLALNLIYQF